MTFEEILSDLGVDSATTGNKHCHAGWLQFDCPFCSFNSGYLRMGYNFEKGHTVCWVCGFHFISMTISALVDRTVGWNKDRVTQYVNDLEKTTYVGDRIEWTGAGKLVLPKGVKNMAPCHKDYLESQGISWKKAARIWNVQGIGLAATLAWRLFIPIDFGFNTLSWTTRSIDRGIQGPRYQSASPEQEKVSHKTLLYGENYAGNSVLVVEGPKDVWKIGPGAVGLFGLSYTRHQVNRIARFPKRYICMDNEYLAQEVAQQLVDDLSVLPGETHLVTIDAKDPGDACDKEVRALRRLLR